jgi:hypothetical protein
VLIGRLYRLHGHLSGQDTFVGTDRRTDWTIDQQICAMLLTGQARHCWNRALCVCTRSSHGSRKRKVWSATWVRTSGIASSTMSSLHITSPTPVATLAVFSNSILQLASTP